MKIEKTERGFEVLVHPRYVEPHDMVRLAGQSSAIRDYEDAFGRPGSSCLWIGDDLHLDRDEVRAFVAALQRWLDTGSLDE